MSHTQRSWHRESTVVLSTLSIFLQSTAKPLLLLSLLCKRFGAQSNLLISTMFGVAQGSLMEFPKDRPVLLREYSTNHYSVIPYFLAKFSLELVTVFMQVAIQLLVAFWLMGFKMMFLQFLALNFLLAISSTSVGVFIGSLVEDPSVAAELMPALIVPQLLFSGFFIQVELIPAFLRWAQYLVSSTFCCRFMQLSMMIISQIAFYYCPVFIDICNSFGNAV